MIGIEREEMNASIQKNRRQVLYRAIHESMGDRLSEEELDIHFTHMPDRYWPRATEESVTEHLLLIRQFFAHLNTSHAEATTPVVAWRQIPKRNVTEVTICSWDRLGLLAHVAGAFAAANLNILRADVYTRVDSLALDVFEITDAAGNFIADEAQLHTMTALLSTALRPNAKAPKVPFKSGHARSSQPPKVYYDAEPTFTQTVIVIEADDQVGLLYRVFSVLADCRINVSQAIITTESGRVGDVFYVTDDNGRPITDTFHLDHIREGLLAAV
ncbi:MAG: ACT domain-containing protein [Verrucomicrobiota bacterium]